MRTPSQAKDAKQNSNTNQKKGNDKNKKTTRELGAAYKSKKAGGDVMKKGQTLEPYAYVPLDGKSYTKKNRVRAVSEIATVVRGGKRKNR